MVQSKFRVGGGYTTITYNGKPLAYIDIIQETAPQPVAAPQAIQPIDASYPIEIAFPAALQAGTLSIQIREQWYWDVWAELANSGAYNATVPTGTVAGGVTGAAPDYNTAQDLLEVFKVQLAQGAIDIVKVITDPLGNQRTITYHGAVIVNVMVDETVNIGAMTFPKQIQFMYIRRLENYYPKAAIAGGSNAYRGAPNNYNY